MDETGAAAIPNGLDRLTGSAGDGKEITAIYLFALNPEARSTGLPPPIDQSLDVDSA